MKNLIIIAAISENNVIGIEGKLPWKIPEDMKHFKLLTSGSTVLMGRKTFESIGKPLKERENIVLTQKDDYKKPGILVAHTMEEALAIATRENIYVIGGQEVYREALPIANRMELTRIHKTYNGDATFPKVDYSQWQLNNEFREKEFSFLSYSRLI
jgi:dihydrofolate reductase